MGRKTEFRVGVLVVFAIALTTFWLLFLKEFKIRTATFPVHVSFGNVAGIKQGAEVDILGVTKGKVAGVDLQKQRVVLTLAIEEGTFISSDAKFFLQSDLVNPATIGIEQGSSETAIAEDANVMGSESGGIGQLMDQSSQLIASLQNIAAQLDAVTAGGRIENLLGEFESNSKELNLLVTESRGKATSILDRVDKLAATLEAIAAENRKPMADAIENVNRFAVNADSLTRQLGVLTEGLKTVSDRLEAGEGSLGKALTDDVLYNNVTNTVARLDSLLDAIKQNPKDFVSFSIF